MWLEAQRAHADSACACRHPTENLLLGDYGGAEWRRRILRLERMEQCLMRTRVMKRVPASLRAWQWKDGGLPSLDVFLPLFCPSYPSSIFQCFLTHFLNVFHPSFLSSFLSLSHPSFVTSYLASFLTTFHSRFPTSLLPSFLNVFILPPFLTSYLFYFFACFLWSHFFPSLLPFLFPFVHLPNESLLSIWKWGTFFQALAQCSHRVRMLKCRAAHEAVKRRRTLRFTPSARATDVLLNFWDGGRD